jgi:hypothetical protein
MTAWAKQRCSPSQTNTTLAFQAGPYRGAGFSGRAGAGLGFQKGNLRSASRVSFIRSRLLTRAPFIPCRARPSAFQ